LDDTIPDIFVKPAEAHVELANDVAGNGDSRPQSDMAGKPTAPLDRTEQLLILVGRDDAQITR
jgi:hypothetical protein